MNRSRSTNPGRKRQEPRFRGTPGVRSGGGSREIAFAVPAIPVFSELDDPATNPNGNRLRPIACPQLLHDVLDVNLHGFF